MQDTHYYVTISMRYIMRSIASILRALSMIRSYMNNTLDADGDALDTQLVISFRVFDIFCVSCIKPRDLRLELL